MIKNVRTPLMLPEVSERDGASKIGPLIKLVDQILAIDGALIKVPSLIVLEDRIYVLFFSSHYFLDKRYNVKYAWSENRVEGPYQRTGSRGKESLL